MIPSGPRDPSPNNWAVSLGSVLRSGSGAVVIPIQRIVIHPQFNSTNMAQDVALLELAVPAPMSYTIQPVCLPSPVHSFLETAECYITGWGSTREGGGCISRSCSRAHELFVVFMSEKTANIM